ncbi:toll/interleukin-1 receptor domain-containing protein [Aequorivita echinoideorum]|uniref:TIR domain-containing protein n=1 Tax=Aequorivita echinoideorum TaxID=1549647 RepID=A0ABS5S626_9FLAO|nr:toll/interleukin-1 receptor domain-containing protein [Aequorivita echinoideorum]MBT0608671.1 TIR domain-containing protein [Aequorivita echinoideorum]
MNLFFSYSRKQTEEVVDLVDFLSIYHTCWFDSKIVAGAEWWKEILSQIRNCDVFIFVLSNDSNNSKACLAELQYAQNLGQYMVILKVDDLKEAFIPDFLKGKNITSYKPDDKARKNVLARILKGIEDRGDFNVVLNLDAREPEIPFSELSLIHSQIRKENSISEAEQASLLFRIEKLMAAKDVEIEDIKILISDFQNRSDTTRIIFDKLNALLPSTKERAPEIQDRILNDILKNIATYSDDVQIQKRLANQYHTPNFLYGRWQRIRTVQNLQNVPVTPNEVIIFNNNFSFQVIRNNMQTNFGTFMFDMDYISITFINGMIDTRNYRCFANELHIVQYMNNLPFLIDCYKRI